MMRIFHKIIARSSSGASGPQARQSRQMTFEVFLSLVWIIPLFFELQKGQGTIFKDFPGMGWVGYISS